MGIIVRRRLAPAAALVAAACFSYTPVTTVPAPGAEVRVRLTDYGTAELARYLGPRVVAVDGRVVDRREDAVRLAVGTVRTVDGSQQQWRGEQAVDFPVAALGGIERRSLSRTRTALVTGGFVAAMAVVGYHAVQSGGGGTVSGGGGGGGNPP